MMLCKNCERTVQESFCSHCGQKTSTGRLDFNQLASDVRNNVLQIEKGFIYTIIQLFSRPGKTIRAYIEGRRKPYHSPIMFVIILAAVYGLTAHAVGTNTILEDFFDGWYEGVGKEQSYGQVLLWISANYQYGSLMLIPVLSLASYIAYQHSEYNYFEHFVLNAYITGIRTLIYIPLTIGKSIYNPYHVFDDLILLTAIGTNIWVYVRFFNGKTVLGHIGSLTAFIVLAFIFLFISLILLGIGSTNW